MRLLHEILLPTDFSPSCIDVARYAAGIARHFSSKLALLHVLPPRDPALAAFGGGPLLEEVLAHQEEETCNTLNSYLADVFQGVSMKRIVSEGDAGETITAYLCFRASRVGHDADTRLR